MAMIPQINVLKLRKRNPNTPSITKKIPTINVRSGPILPAIDFQSFSLGIIVLGL